MKINTLKPSEGSRKSRRRLGRGVGSGRGKTAARGQKGQKSRSGFSQGSGWEGGRSRLVMRLPKRGFNRYRVPMQIVNVEALDRFRAGTKISAETLADAGLIRHADRPVKLLGRGELKKRFTVTVDAASASAVQAVVAAGGQVVGFDVEATAESDTSTSTSVADASSTEAPEAEAALDVSEDATPDDEPSHAEGEEGTEEKD